MPDLQIDALHSIGVIADIPAHQLPPEAWSAADGIRFGDHRARRMTGWQQVFGTPTVVPHFALGVLDSARNPWWIYTSLTKAYVFNNDTHTNITRQTASVDVDYTATESLDWMGDILAGIPILNNGQDVPQFWAAYSASQKLQDLNNWPSTLRAKHVVAFGPFLFALHCTKSGTVSPHLVKWSHPAAPGSLPVSWDETDATRDTGEYEIPSASPGGIVAGKTLGAHLYVFKEGAVWRATYIGGRAVFSFQAFSTIAGAVGPRAVTTAPDGMHQIFVSDNDILINNGHKLESIIDGRNRNVFFSRLNKAERHKTFCFANPKQDEIWVCFPADGSVEPNAAFIWNMRDNTWTGLEEINFRGATVGPAEEKTTTWSGVTGTWSTITGPWSTLDWTAVVVSSPSESKLGLLNLGFARFSDTIVASLQREGLALIGQSRSREPIVDYKRRKLVTRLWLKAEGKFEIRLGAQETVDAVVSWSDWQTFDADTDMYLDFTANGRAIGIEFRSVDSFDFSLIGYKIELRLLGNF